QRHRGEAFGAPTIRRSHVATHIQDSGASAHPAAEFQRGAKDVVSIGVRDVFDSNIAWLRLGGSGMLERGNSAHEGRHQSGAKESATVKLIHRYMLLEEAPQSHYR